MDVGGCGCLKTPRDWVDTVCVSGGAGRREGGGAVVGPPSDARCGSTSLTPDVLACAHTYTRTRLFPFHPLKPTTPHVPARVQVCLELQQTWMESGVSEDAVAGHIQVGAGGEGGERARANAPERGRCMLDMQCGLGCCLGGLYS